MFAFFKNAISQTFERIGAAARIAGIDTLAGWSRRNRGLALWRAELACLLEEVCLFQSGPIY